MPSETGPLAAFLGLIAAAAVLYSSVGHGGASAYLAVMALFGVPAAVMKQAAALSVPEAERTLSAWPALSRSSRDGARK